jgi:hypothetical protein
MSSYVCTMANVAKQGDIITLETFVPQQMAVHEIHAPPDSEAYWIISVEINGREQFHKEVPGNLLSNRVAVNRPLPYPLFVVPARAQVRVKVRIKTDEFFTLCFCQYSDILIGQA